MNSINIDFIKNLHYFLLFELNLCSKLAKCRNSKLLFSTVLYYGIHHYSTGHSFIQTRNAFNNDSKLHMHYSTLNNRLNYIKMSNMLQYIYYKLLSYVNNKITSNNRVLLIDGTRIQLDKTFNNKYNGNI